MADLSPPPNMRSWAGRLAGVGATIRYIKLGEGGAWLNDCLENGHLLFHDLVPHDVAGRAEWLAARRIYEAAGRVRITDDLREIRDFYEQPADCLWITFGRGRLWWAYSDPDVRLRDDGVRERTTLAAWSCLDAHGRELRIDDLSTSLTQTAAYRRTICSVTASEKYLLRRLNAEADTHVERVEGLLADLTTAVGAMIAELHWRDFEVLVDLIFARSGWRRVGAVGGSGQADSDLILQQAATGERAFVQIKSKANAATLRDYQTRFEAYPDMDRFFFACHSPMGNLAPLADPRVSLWLRPELAAQAVEAGLVDWLLCRRR